jgi:hypothetical protein
VAHLVATRLAGTAPPVSGRRYPLEANRRHRNCGKRLTAARESPVGIRARRRPGIYFCGREMRASLMMMIGAVFIIESVRSYSGHLALYPGQLAVRSRCLVIGETWPLGTCLFHESHELRRAQCWTEVKALVLIASQLSEQGELL